MPSGGGRRGRNASPVLQVTMENARPSLADLQSHFLPRFATQREKNAAAALLQAITLHCEMSPYDSTLTFPDGSQSLSPLDVLLRFFVSGQHVDERPPDALRFLAFLKSIRFHSQDLANMQVN